MLVIRKVDWSIFRNHYLFLKTGISHLTYFLTQLITIKIMSSLIINSKHRQRNRWSNNENISDRTISYHYNDVSNSLQLIWHLICYWSFTVLITVWRISTDNQTFSSIKSCKHATVAGKGSVKTPFYVYSHMLFIALLIFQMFSECNYLRRIMCIGVIWGSSSDLFDLLHGSFCFYLFLFNFSLFNHSCLVFEKWRCVFLILRIKTIFKNSFFFNQVDFFQLQSVLGVVFIV